MKVLRKRLLTLLIILIVLCGAVVLLPNYLVNQAGQTGIYEAVDKVPQAQAAIVLGARVFGSGAVSGMLADRLDTAIELYQAGKVHKLLLTGDHGRVAYDEVNTMRRYAEQKGIPPEDIFMDHAGFSTYDSMYRARDVFEVNSAVVVTQDFHLPRAVYIARQLGLQAWGLKADKHFYGNIGFYYFREAAARVKAVLQIHLLNSKPRFLGEAIPITGDGRLTRDKKI